MLADCHHHLVSHYNTRPPGLSSRSSLLWTMINWGGVVYKVQYKWKQFKKKIWSYLYQSRDMIVFLIPSDHIRDLPKSQALPLGFVSIVLLVSAAVYLFVATFWRLKNTSYLSVQEDDGSVCEEVLKRLNNDYYCACCASDHTVILTIFTRPRPRPLRISSLTLRVHMLFQLTQMGTGMVIGTTHSTKLCTCTLPK